MRRVLLSVLALVPFIPVLACSAILGIEPGILDEPDSAGGGGSVRTDASTSGDALAVMHGDSATQGETAPLADTAPPGDGSGPASEAATPPDAAQLADVIPNPDAAQLADRIPNPDVAAPSDVAQTPDSSGPPDASSNGGTDASDANTIPDPCTLGPETAKAIFVVSQNGSNDPTLCGSADTPCRGISLGITRAFALQRSIVYVNAGTYDESVHLVAGIKVEGGWNDLGGVWTRDCSAHPEALAIIAPTTDSRAVVAESLNGSTTMHWVTIRSKAGVTTASGQGESSYGVFATGTGANPTTVVLDTVAIVAKAGGDGATGGTPATPAATGNGCTPGSGADSSPSAGTGAGAGAGSFSVTGYSPGDAPQGPSGAPGENGTSAASSSVPCWTCSNNPNCSGSAQNGSFSTGTAGVPGCGGTGGPGGLGGKGGGASIGIFAWGATVTISGGAVASASGGHGGTGGAGSPGGAGGPGAAGDPGSSCTTGCGSRQICAPACVTICVATSGTATGGAGGLGGHGGQGGLGGGGAGGPSYSVYQGGGATVSMSANPVLMAGSGGTSLGNGPTGDSKSQGP